MRLFFKYLLWFFSFLTVVILYLLQTQLGHHTLAQFLSSYLTKNSNNRLEVYSLKIDSYPILEMNITINDRADVHLKGIVDNSKIDMNYHLVGESFHFNSLKLEDSLDIKGEISGILSSLSIKGDGTLFDGDVDFSFRKELDAFYNMSLILRDVDSKKVLKFLHHKELIDGRADIDAKFKRFSKYQKDGKAVIIIRDAKMPTVSGGVDFGLKSEIEFKDVEYLYRGGIKSKIGNLTIVDGYFHQRKKEAHGLYSITLKDLSYFEPFLKHKYQGGFEGEGKFEYRDGIYVTGESDKFGGITKYNYKKDSVELELKGVSLVKLLEFFSYPKLLSAKVYGSIDYEIADKIVLINTKLKETRFRKTKITDMISKTIGIDMLQDVYNNSSFVGGYENHILKSTLKIDNGKRHVYLTDTKMSSKNNSINSKFEVKIAGQELYGDIYGTLKNPKVSIDMKKLLKYQLNKRLGDLLGTKNRESIKKEFKSVKKDVTKTLEKIDVKSVKEKAKSFLNDFF